MNVPEDLFRGIERGTASYTYRGVRCVKNPIDLAVLARLLWDAKPRTIIEVGSMDGGSALWMRDQMRSYGVNCRVCSVDVSPPNAPACDDLRFYKGDGRNLGATFSPIFMDECRRPLLMIEDADHQPETTTAVLNFFDRWSLPGEYIVVEDGDAEKYYPGSYGGGPLAAIGEFLMRRGADFEVDRKYTDMFGLTFNPDGYIRRKLKS